MVSVPYCAHLCMKCSLGISNFLEEISSLSHSIVICIVHLGRLSYLSLLFFGTLLSDGYIFLFLLCLYLLFFSQLFVKPLRQPFCLFAFLFLGIILITISYTVLPTSIHSFSGTLSIRSNPLNLFTTFAV